jgi:NADH-quinone oxidoreductase subunit G
VQRQLHRRDEQVKRVIARDNPDVDDGWLCDRGRYGFEMFAAEERVDGPRLRGGATTWDEAIAKAGEALSGVSEIHPPRGGSISDAPSTVAAIVGDASNEEGYLVQRILREALGSPHVESRVAGGPNRDTLLALAQPNLSARVRDIDTADAILLIGSDPLHSSPILDLRIRKAMRRNGARLAIATARPTALDGGAAAVTRHAPGGATAYLSELSASLRLGTESGSASEAADVLRDAKRVVIVWGERIAREGEEATTALLDVAAALDLAGQDGSGLLEIPDVTNARGLREAGCLPDAGPGLTSAPLGGISAPSGALTGKRTEEIREALESGELKALLLFGVDPLRDFPDTAAWQRPSRSRPLVCFSTFENATTAKADVVFPLETHAEKDGTVTHPDGRLQRVRPSARAPATSVPTGGPRRAVPRLGHDTGVTSQPSAFAALAGGPVLRRHRRRRDRRSGHPLAGARRGVETCPQARRGRATPGCDGTPREGRAEATPAGALVARHLPRPRAGRSPS